VRRTIIWVVICSLAGTTIAFIAASAWLAPASACGVFNIVNHGQNTVLVLGCAPQPVWRSPALWSVIGLLAGLTIATFGVRSTRHRESN
jgi:hypothetical protein